MSVRTDKLIRELVEIWALVVGSIGGAVACIYVVPEWLAAIWSPDSTAVNLAWGLIGSLGGRLISIEVLKRCPWMHGTKQDTPWGDESSERSSSD